MAQYLKWKPTAELTMATFSGPLGIAQMLEKIAHMVYKKKLPPKVASVMVQSLVGASKCYRDAAAIQRDAGTGEEIPIVLENMPKVRGFRLRFDFESKEDEPPTKETPNA